MVVGCKCVCVCVGVQGIRDLCGVDVQGPCGVDVDGGGVCVGVSNENKKQAFCKVAFYLDI